MQKGAVRIIALALTCSLFAGCALFQPTDTGECPAVTTTVVELTAYSGGLAAIKNGASPVLLGEIADTIDAAVATGHFDITVLNAAFAKYAGEMWAPYLAGAEIIYASVYQASIDQQLNAQACTTPVLRSISRGMKQAVALAGESPRARLAPYQAE